MSIAPTDTLTAADHAALDALYRPAGDCLDGLTTLGGPPTAMEPVERDAETLTAADLDSMRVAETPTEPAEGEWPDPLPLPGGLPPVQPFDYDLLPKSLHAWIADISARMQCPPDYLAATVIIMAGTLVGRKVGIRPKRHDDWQVIVNLFGLLVGRPSLMKSPAAKEAMKFLTRLEAEAMRDYMEAVAEHEAAELVAKATVKVKGEALKAAVKAGNGAAEIAKSMTAETEGPPTRKRYLTNNTTVEKLGVLLAENPNGVLLFCDEIIGLLKSMDRDGHEGDRAFYLTAWSGDSRYTYDRIGRGTLDIEAAIVSILGCIQPGVLQDYLRGAVNGGGGDDGLMQRFQVSVWPDAPDTWTNIDHYPDAEAKSLATAALQRLADLTPFVVDAERDNFDPDSVHFLRFDRDAQEIFDRWRADLEGRLRDGSEHPAIESHLAKYRSLMPSLALILHLLDGGRNPITEVAAVKAVAWCKYLESHARRLYASVTEAPAVAARALAERIKKGEVQSPFTSRDVYRNHWSGLDRESAGAAIDVLVSLKWLEELTQTTAGRTKTAYLANPKIHDSP